MPSDEPEIPEDVLPLVSLTDVGKQLGVKRSLHKFEYWSDFDKNGLLWWLGTNEGNSDTWANPHVSGIIEITTSHAMYSPAMKIEDIIGREAGASCYWGSSSPQYFIVDLKDKKLRINYFTLRHGYQAANSYIQNWTFSCSNDKVHWVVLHESMETPFNKAFDTKSWPVKDVKEYFRYFKVTQAGNYSMGRGTNVGS